jgi:hypothetical protein
MPKSVACLGGSMVRQRATPVAADVRDSGSDASSTAETRGLARDEAAEQPSPSPRSAASDADSGQLVSRAFPSWNRSILTEIYLCHPCSCSDIEN